MVYDHMVKVNGKYYQAGENVPETGSKAMEGTTPLPFSENDSKEDFGEERQYTKSEINRMTTADLQELADTEGIENAHNINGGELKKVLIEHFGL